MHMEFIEEKLFFIERRNIKKLTNIEIDSLLKLYSNINCNYLFNINKDIFHMKKVYID